MKSLTLDSKPQLLYTVCLYSTDACGASDPHEGSPRKLRSQENERFRGFGSGFEFRIWEFPKTRDPNIVP